MSLADEEGKGLVARLRLGDLQLSSRVVEARLHPFRGFNFDNNDFAEVLNRAGCLLRFSRDYWAFRGDESEPLPWDYGDFPRGDFEPLLRRIRRRSGT